MAKRESTQHVLDRVRKPRVHITYDVETGGAIEMKELPFVVGVLADLSGQPVVDDEGKKIRLKDRKFVRIDRDNFHDVLGGMKPAVNLRVANRLSGEEGAQMNVALKFKHLSDFDPEQVVNQVDPLRKLLDARRRLSDLKGKLDGNDKLDELLTKVLSNPVELGKLKDAIGVTAPAEGEGGGSTPGPTEESK
jgi:type VI secretion system protein ImpB